jgi:protein Tex
MYQHDFSEKVLDSKLHITSVDAVTEVGVDANACSLEILEKVPGMTKTLAERIIQAWPLQSRCDLLKIAGLGPKTFENCAAFIRVHGAQDLDRTMCHPESYELAWYLLQKLKWDLDNPSSVRSLPAEMKRAVQWQKLVAKAASQYEVTEYRVLSVMDHLICSITNPDPRLRDDNGGGNPTALHSTNGCTLLASHLMSLDELRKACPVRNILGHVRNIVDFGAFVDFGVESSDGLIHRSKLGTVPLDSLLVGQEIAIDILGVSSSNRVSVSISGLGLPADSLDSHQSQRDHGPHKKHKPASNIGSQKPSDPTKRRRTARK